MLASLDGFDFDDSARKFFYLFFPQEYLAQFLLFRFLKLLQ